MRGFYRWSGKWWPGLIPLAFLWLAAAWFSTAPTERDIAAQVGSALKGTVLDRTRINVAGRDVTLSADAFSEEGRRTALSQVESAPGVRRVNDATRMVPEVRPYVWSADRDVVRVTLGGNVPLPAVRSRLMEAARASLGGVEVADRMSFGRGAPPRFENAASILIEQLARLRDGRLSITDNKVSVSGMARELGGREAVNAALRNLPDGIMVTTNELKAPPYVLQANKDPVTSTLTLSGNVPDNATHASLLEAAGRKFVSEKKVTDNLRASLGAPRDFAAAVNAALGALSRLSTGTLTVSDREVRLSGDAMYDVAASEIRESLPRLVPQGWKALVEISVKPPASPVDSAVCQQLFNNLLGQSNIGFDSNSAAITPDSAALIDRLVETAQRCPSSIEVAGHTDASGSDEANLALSQRRAQAVVDAMVRAGLPPERFVPRGYGSAQPVAPDAPEQDRAKNRRIEFIVR
jgi:OOP family OmpA-OmpF porin